MPAVAFAVPFWDRNGTAAPCARGAAPTRVEGRAVDHPDRSEERVWSTTMATNTTSKTLGVASVLVGLAAATVVIRSAVAGAVAKVAPASETANNERRCKPGEKDCKG